MQIRNTNSYIIRIEDDREYNRKKLTDKYKPLFDQYEMENGIPREKMLQLLEDGTIAIANDNDILRGTEKKQTFIKNMDKNEDGRITWDEFYTAMIDPRNEDEYRDWLTKMYKYLFDPYEESGGIPKQQLDEYMKDGTISGLRESKTKEFVDKMDTNENNLISWKEFYTAMTIKRRKDLPLGKRLLISLVRNVDPNVKRRESRIREKKTEIHGTDSVDGGIPFQKLDGKELLDREGEDECDVKNYIKGLPITTSVVTLAIIIVFIVYAIEIKKREVANPKTWNKLTMTSGVAYWSPLIWNPWSRQQAWRWVSYCLLHQGYYHLIFNVIIFLIFGITLEVANTFYRIGPLLLGGILAGSITVSIFDYKHSLVGISGGCYSLVGAHYAVVIMNWQELQNDWLKIAERPMKFLTSGVMRLIVLTLFVAIDFGVAIYSATSQGKNGTSFAAHVGGLFCGIFLGVVLVNNPDIKKFEKIIFVIGLAGFICYMIFGIFWNIFYPNFPKNTDNSTSK